MTWMTCDDQSASPAAASSAGFLPAAERERLGLGWASPNKFPLQLSVEVAPRRRRVWVVKLASGGDLRVLAERHTAAARHDGAELRFYDGEGDGERRVATVRAGGWHWVCAEDALDPAPETDEEAES